MTTTTDDTSWERVASPVLSALLAAEREGRRMHGDELRDLVAEVSDHVFHNTMSDLLDGGFIEARTAFDGGEPYPEYLGLRLRERGRQVVRDWPTGSVVEAFIDALDAAIERATEPAERTKLEKVRAASGEVGQAVLAGVLSTVVAQVAGLR